MQRIAAGGSLIGFHDPEGGVFARLEEPGSADVQFNRQLVSINLIDPTDSRDLTEGGSSDFDQLFRRWAEASANGLTELKALSPVDVNGARLAR